MPDISVRTLLCHPHVPLALKCLSSLVRSSRERIGLVIHDDGTLTGDDRAVLREKLPVTSIVTRAEATERVMPLLSRHPACAHFRNRHPLALKVLDIPLLETADLYFCDSDILFLKPHVGLFQGVLESADFVFMRDEGQSYSLRPWSVWPFTDFRVLSRLNTGLFAMKHGIFDLDYLEYFLESNLSKPAFIRRPTWSEQTCWAVLAARKMTLTYDPRQIGMAHPSVLPGTAGIVALHFTSSVRDLINGFEGWDAGASMEPEVMRLRKASPASAAMLLLADMAKKMRR